MLEISDFICKDPSIAQLVLYIASALLRYEVVWGHIDVLVVAVRTLSMYGGSENSTTGPQPYQPYQPYEAEVTNSLFPKWATLRR